MLFSCFPTAMGNTAGLYILLFDLSRRMILSRIPVMAASYILFYRVRE